MDTFGPHTVQWLYKGDGGLTVKEAGFPIGTVARLTGLTVEALRAWERRYGVVNPGRDARGRLYSAGDIERLRLLKQLVDGGHAIGQIAPLSPQALAKLAAAARMEPAPAASPALGSPRPAVDIGALLALGKSLRMDLLERRLVDLTLFLPPRELVFRALIPLASRVGDEWCKGRVSVAEEHAVTAVVTGILAALIRQHADLSAPMRLLFATPANERHCVGLMSAALLAASSNMGVVYLGAEVPPDQVADVARRTGAAAVVLSQLTDPGSRGAVAELERIAVEVGAVAEVWVGGPRVPARPRSRVAMLELADLSAFEREIERLRVRGAGALAVGGRGR